MHLYFTRHMALGVGQECFDVAHDGFDELPLVQQNTVPVGELLFPVKLLFGQDVLFQRVVGLDDNQWRGGLEAHAALDADNGVADVDVAANTERLRQFGQLLYGLHGRFGPLTI